LAEKGVQPAAELLQVVAQPVEFNVGVLQLMSRLLAGREQQNQRSDKYVVGGDVGSFLEDGAVRDSRSGACSISAEPFRRAMIESAVASMWALEITQRVGPARAPWYSARVVSIRAMHASLPHSQNTVITGS
jgi:hypothetical protein